MVSNLTQYIMVRNGDPILYLATYVTAEPAVGELRWITRLQLIKFRTAHRNPTTTATQARLKARTFLVTPTATPLQNIMGGTAPWI